jgi:putative endonuclease
MARVPPISPSVQRPGRATGARGEELAAAHLERLGFRVIARNVHVGAGEIDLIAFDGRTLVFVEVKSSRARPGAAEPRAAPLERLGIPQRMRLRRLAARWLAQAPERPRAQTIRFDAIGVLLDSDGRLGRLDHLEGAW